MNRGWSEKFSQHGQKPLFTDARIAPMIFTFMVQVKSSEISATVLTFLCGVGGSAAIEILNIYEFYVAETKLPPRYAKIGFYVIRTLLALCGGGLAVAHKVSGN